MIRGLVWLQNWVLSRGVFSARAQREQGIGDLLRLIWPENTNLGLRRIGSTFRADGGYLVPDDLEGIGRVFSPGVADNMEFEKHF